MQKIAFKFYEIENWSSSQMVPVFVQINLSNDVLAVEEKNNLYCLPMSARRFFHYLQTLIRDNRCLCPLFPNHEEFFGSEKIVNVSALLG